MSERSRAAPEALAVAMRREDPGTLSLREWAPRPRSPEPGLSSGTLESAVGPRGGEVEALLGAGAEVPRLPGAGGDDEPLPVVSTRSYDIAGELARGGLGRILRGRDRRLNRPVAIKEALSDGRDARARFLREVAVTARLQHPGIVPVYEAGCWPDGDAFYAMKLISGRSLKEAIAEKKTLDERLSLLPNVIAVAEAVAYAHDAGVIHRDLKPANVLVGPFGETVVIDWGVARDVTEPPGVPASEDTLPPGFRPPERAPALTQTGAILGTPAYMPPEQAAGEPVDMRADVYAIGAILYHVLAGTAPYEGGRGTEVLAWVLMRPPSPIDEREPGVPPDLAAIAHKAMARSPDHRYASAKELAEELRRFQTGQLVGAHHYSRGALVWRWLRRNRTLMVVASVLVAALAATTVVSIQRVLQSREAALVARNSAQQRTNALTLKQAEALMATDPTAALVALRDYPPDGDNWPAVQVLAAEAASRGVSSAVLKTRPPGAEAVSVSPDGAHVASIGLAQGLHVWNTATGAHEASYGVPGDFPMVDYSADGRHLIAAGGGTVRLWDLKAGGPSIDLATQGFISYLDASADGDFLALAGDAGVAYASADRPRALVWLTRERASRVQFSSDGAYLFAVTRDGVLRTWPFRRRGAMKLLLGSRVQDAVLARGSNRILFLTRDGTLGTVALDGSGYRVLRQHTDVVRPIEISRDGRLAVTATGGSAVVLWDLDRGHSRTLRQHQHNVTCIEISSDSRYVASGDDGGGVFVHDFSSGAGRALPGHHSLVQGFAFVSQPPLLVSAADDSVRVWPLSSPASRVLQGHQSNVLALAFTPSGDSIASTGADKSVRHWSVRGR